MWLYYLTSPSARCGCRCVRHRGVSEPVKTSPSRHQGTRQLPDCDWRVGLKRSPANLLSEGVSVTVRTEGSYLGTQLR